MTMWFPMNVMKFVDYGHWEEVYNGNCMRFLRMLFFGRQFECIGSCLRMLLFGRQFECIDNLNAECWVRCPSQPVSYCIGNFHAECISNLNAECWVRCPYLPVFYCIYILCAEWGDFRPSLHVVFEMLNVVIAIYIMPALDMFIT